VRAELESLGADHSWCIEKEEMLGVLRWARDEVCGAEGCQARMKEACSRRLSCGHACGGVRGEGECLPCLRPECARPARRGERPLPTCDELCGICLTEPLGCAPSILLDRCGHVVHLECALERIRHGYPSPAISFGFLSCPQCGGSEQGRSWWSGEAATMSHPALAPALQGPLALRAEVSRRARQRMHAEGRARAAPELQPGGSFEGRPGEFAMRTFKFYECSRCSKPYFGGERACEAGGAAEDQEGRDFKREDLVCGACSAGARGAQCPSHGTELIEHKCRFCCSVATWFCFGTTHFCDACHVSRPDAGGGGARRRTCRASTCPLGVDHPDHGVEFCLGCGLCRRADAL